MKEAGPADRNRLRCSRCHKTQAELDNKAAEYDVKIAVEQKRLNDVLARRPTAEAALQTWKTAEQFECTAANVARQAALRLEQLEEQKAEETTRPKDERGLRCKDFASEAAGRLREVDAALIDIQKQLGDEARLVQHARSELARLIAEHRAETDRNRQEIASARSTPPASRWRCTTIRSCS